MNSIPFQGKPFNITVIQVYASTINAEEAEIDWNGWNLTQMTILSTTVGRNPLKEME